jgi:hypothetical protein
MQRRASETATARVSLAIGGHSTQYLAEVVREPGAHETIRALLRRRYGLRDWWVGLLLGTSRSWPVRLRVPS